MASLYSRIFVNRKAAMLSWEWCQKIGSEEEEGYTSSCGEKSCPSFSTPFKKWSSPPVLGIPACSRDLKLLLRFELKILNIFRIFNAVLLLNTRIYAAFGHWTPAVTSSFTPYGHSGQIQVEAKVVDLF